MTTTPRTIGKLIVAVAAILAVTSLLWLALRPAQKRRANSNVVDYVRKHVRGADSVLTTRGRGFLAQSDKGTLRSDETPLKGQPRPHAIAATAPATADGNFGVSVGGARQLGIRLTGAARAQASVERGVAVYREVHRDVDVLALRDPERFELAYVVHSLQKAPDLSLELELQPNQALRVEPASGDLLVTNASTGRPQLRISKPVAFDAGGVKRTGSYTISDKRVRLAMSWNGLTAPVLVDPHVLVPFWSILQDGRAPGNATYDSQPVGSGGGFRKVSRETLVFGHANEFLMLRPARSQQFQDTMTNFGVMSYDDPGVDPTPLAPDTDGPVHSDAVLSDWQRSYGSEMETWLLSTEQPPMLRDTLGLPGLSGAGITYDPVRNVNVLFGGAAPRFTCTKRFSTVDPQEEFSRCTLSNQMDLGLTYEYDFQNWTTKRIAGAPPPRLRPALAPFAGGVVLFGGRELVVDTKLVRWYGEPFPEGFGGALLNDLWFYDATSWRKIPVSNAPPARENAQLVYDTRRKRLILVGGDEGIPVTCTSGGCPPLITDRFSLWEFDGTDWIQIFAPNDAALPESFRGREGSVAFWSEARGTTLLFGGRVPKLDFCPLSGAALEQAKTNAANDAALKQQLLVQGCFGGYTHDTWEWDGLTLRQLTYVAYGGLVGTEAVYQQVATDQGWAGLPKPAPSSGPGEQSPFKRLPWRYDARPDHYALRSTLERAYLERQDQFLEQPVRIAGTYSAPTSAVPPAGEQLVSPLMAPGARLQVAPSPNGDVVVLVNSDDGSVYRTDGHQWSDLTHEPAKTPFSRGPNDFFAAAWDETRKLMYLFDPTDGWVWYYDGSWHGADLPGPGVWPPGASIRRKRDTDPSARDLATVSFPGLDYLDDTQPLEDIVRHIPRMTVDIQRSTIVMLYGSLLWEISIESGPPWVSSALPPALSSCTAARLLAYDRGRHRTVVVGCKVPGQTWEWDGSNWYGPYPGPYSAQVMRAEGDPGGGSDLRWTGTLQMAWAHPNALFETPSLGGVSTFDGDGTLRTWDGSSWRDHPSLAEATETGNRPGYLCDSGWAMEPNKEADRGLPLRYYMIRNWDFKPMCFFPPGVEDPLGRRVLAFRDGIRGLRALDVTDASAVWQRPYIGESHAVFGGTTTPTIVNPHPLELVSPERVYMHLKADPANRHLPDGTLISATQSKREEMAHNLFWPFRVFPDFSDRRIRVLTHRGTVWELGADPRSSLGEACQTLADCADPAARACIDGVCCNDSACGSRCMTCVGTQAGVCEPVALGQPDPHGTCGSGDCSQVCPGTYFPSSCIYQSRPCGTTSCENGQFRDRGTCSSNSTTCVAAAPTACPGGLACADERVCKTTCSSRGDCISPFATCSGAAQCGPDAVSTLATARGIVPASFDPPEVLTPQELANVMTQVGLPTDTSGRVILPTPGVGGLQAVFDPTARSPLLGLQSCVYRLHACIRANKKFDECIAATPRCESSTPWDNDPAGVDCCPEECLLTYLQARPAQTPGTALQTMIQSTCYPGLSSMEL